MQDNIDKLKKQLDERQEKDLKEFKPTGTAIVVFNYSRHKRNMTEDHMRSNTYADSVMTPAMHRQFDVLTRVHPVLLSPCFVLSGSLSRCSWKPGSLYCGASLSDLLSFKNPEH